MLIFFCQYLSIDQFVILDWINLNFVKLQIAKFLIIIDTILTQIADYSYDQVMARSLWWIVL